MASPSISNAFFTNLLLLGFDPSKMEEQFKIPFKEDMFKLPNKKGFEVVTYFLFCKLSALNKELFSKCWPVFDNKTTVAYRSLVNDLLKAVLQEKEVSFPKYSGSALLSPGGDNFVRLMFALSQHVMIKLLKSNTSDHYVLNGPVKSKSFNRSMYTDSVCIAADLNIKSFLDRIQRQAINHQNWISLSRDLQLTYWDLDRDVKELQSKLDVTMTDFQFSSSKDKSLSIEKKLKQSKEKIHQMQLSWQQILKFQSMIKNCKENMDFIFEPDIMRSILTPEPILALNGNFQLAPQSEKNTEDVINSNNILNLTCLITVMKELIQSYQKLLCEIELPELSSSLDHFERQLQEHEKQLSVINDTRKCLEEELIPDLRQSIKNKKVNMYQAFDREKLFDMSPTLSFTPANNNIVGTTPFRNSAIQAKQILSPSLSLQAEKDSACNSAVKTEIKCQSLNHRSGIPKLHNPILRKANHNLSMVTNSEIFKSEGIKETPKSEKHARTAGRYQTKSINKAPVKSVQSSLECFDFNSNCFKPVEQNVTKKNCNPEDELARMVVDDILADDTSMNAAIENLMQNPTSAFDQSVFVSRDKIGRSPTSNQPATELTSVANQSNADVTNELKFESELFDASDKSASSSNTVETAPNLFEDSMNNPNKTDENPTDGKEINAFNYSLKADDYENLNSSDCSLIDDLSASCCLLDSSASTEKEPDQKSVSMYKVAELPSEDTINDKLSANDGIKELISRFLHIRSHMNNNVISTPSNEEVIQEHCLSDEVLKPTACRSGPFKLDEALFQSPSL